MEIPEILKTAVKNFTEITGVRPILTPVKDTFDLQIQMREEKKQFKALIKNEIRAENLHGILTEVGKEKERWLLIANYIPQPLKDELKKQSVNYLEATGNGLIHVGGFFYL